MQGCIQYKLLSCQEQCLPREAYASCGVALPPFMQTCSMLCAAAACQTAMDTSSISTADPIPMPTVQCSQLVIAVNCCCPLEAKLLCALLCSSMSGAHDPLDISMHSSNTSIYACSVHSVSMATIQHTCQPVGRCRQRFCIRMIQP